MERLAHNDGYDKPDVEDNCPAGECCVPGAAAVQTTCLDLERVCSEVNTASLQAGLGVEACVSEDAGRYLCDFVYCKSLVSMAGRSLFIHVPPTDQPYSTDQVTQAIKLVLQSLIKQIQP